MTKFLQVIQRKERDILPILPTIKPTNQQLNLEGSFALVFHGHGSGTLPSFSRKHILEGPIFPLPPQLFFGRFSQWMTVPSLISQRGPRNVLWQLSKRPFVLGGRRCHMVDRFDALQRNGFILWNTAWLFWHLALKFQGSIEIICLNDFVTSEFYRFPSFTKFLGHPSRRLGVVS